MAQQPPPDPADEPAQGFGPARRGGPSWTWSWDFVDLMDLSDQSKSVYRAIRMCLIESKDEANDQLIRLTNEDIGVLSGGRSVSSVKRAMAPLFERGLLEEVESRFTSVRVPGKAKPEVRTVRVLRVHLEPPEGWENYEGYVNPFQKLRAHHAADTSDGIEASETAAQSAGADVNQQSEQQESAAKPTTKKSKPKRSPAKTKKTAGHSGGSHVNEPRANLHGPLSKSEPHTNQGGPSKQEEPTNQGEPEAHPDSEGTSEVGWLASSKKTKRKRVESAGADLLRSLGVAEHALADNAPIVDTALERLGTKHVQAALGDGLSGTANPAGVVLRTRIPQLQNQLKSTGEARRSSKPAWCGADGSNGEDPCDETTRQRERQDTGQPYRCPDCNPNARQQRDDQPAESDRGGVGTIGSLEDLLAG